MKRIILALIVVFFLAGIAAYFWFTNSKHGSGLIFSKIDFSLSVVQERFNGKNRLSYYFDEIAGTCSSSSGKFSEALWPPKRLELSPFLFFPFARPVWLTEPAPNPKKLRCHDSLGHEFEFQAVNPIRAVIERAPGQLMRFTPVSVGRLRISGKSIRILWGSPIGEVEIQSLEEASVLVEVYDDADKKRTNQHLIVEHGKVNARVVQPDNPISSTAVLELRAIATGELKWENPSAIVTPEKAGVILPSGFFWR